MPVSTITSQGRPAAAVPARRYSLANSAGICLGRDYSFGLVRPGLALYGGIPRDEAIGSISQVAFPEAEVVQRRTIRAGETCGYGATWTAQVDTEAAIRIDGVAKNTPDVSCAFNAATHVKRNNVTGPGLLATDGVEVPWE